MAADEIVLSLRKVLGRCFYGSITIFMGVIALFIAFMAVGGWMGGTLHGGIALAVAPLALIAGVFCAIIGVGMMLEVLLGYWRCERLALREDALQCVIGTGDVLDHIPYDNIQDMEVVQRQEETGPPYTIVGLHLTDAKRPDTVLRLVSRLNPADEDDEYDVIIPDLYKLSPEKLHKRLKAKWRKSRPEHPYPTLSPDADWR